MLSNLIEEMNYKNKEKLWSLIKNKNYKKEWLMLKANYYRMFKI